MKDWYVFYYDDKQDKVIVAASNLSEKKAEKLHDKILYPDAEDAPDVDDCEYAQQEDVALAIAEMGRRNDCKTDYDYLLKDEEEDEDYDDVNDPLVDEPVEVRSYSGRGGVSDESYEEMRNKLIL